MSRTVAFTSLTVIAAGVLLLPAGLAAAAQDNERFTDVQKWVERFESPERLKWQEPQQVLRLLGLQEGDEVADIGAGTGYFEPWLAAMVTEKGKVYAIDIEQEMLDYIDQREDFKFNNIKTILADPDDPKLPEGRLAAVLVVNTWHHIEDRVNYIPKLGRGLRPDGRVVIIDFHKRELPVGPPVDQKLSRDEVVAEFEKAGWKLVGESVALRYQYYLTFTP